jgi:hypothetical protein
VAITGSSYTEIGQLNIVTAPRFVMETLLMTNVHVDAVPTSPSIQKVAADPVNPVPTVCILAHPAVPVATAVPE